MATTISTVLNQCLKEFTESITSDALLRYENEVSQRRWSDELGRLRIWAGNIGAHQTGQSSLDYRLRDASHLKSETVKILQRMLRVLRSLTEVMNEEDEDQIDIDEEFHESDTEMEDDKNAMTDVQVLYQSLRNIINLLFRISMAIRRPADHDRLLGIKIKNASFFEPWAQQHVSHKFPNIDADMASRLSAAMARQKAVLKYFERHKAKLGKGLLVTGETESNYLSETVATEMPLVEDMDQLQFLETGFMSGISQTSYAPSIFTANESLSIPNAPRESANNNPFECPYCYLVITIRNTKDWAHHIFRDLMPYVCLSPECSTPSKLYGSRRQWYQHISEAHPAFANLQTGLGCPLCNVDIRPPLTFERHVGHHMEQLALFVLPRVDSAEPDQSEASLGSGSLAVAGDTSNPSSDSEEVDSTNNSRYLLRDSGNVFVSRRDSRNKSQEGSPERQPLRSSDIASTPNYDASWSDQASLQSIDSRQGTGRSKNRVTRRHRYSLRSNSDPDTLSDGHLLIGHLLNGGRSAHDVHNRHQVTAEDPYRPPPRTGDGSPPAGIRIGSSYPYPRPFDPHRRLSDPYLPPLNPHRRLSDPYLPPLDPHRRLSDPYLPPFDPHRRPSDPYLPPLSPTLDRQALHSAQRNFSPAIDTVDGFSYTIQALPPPYWDGQLLPRAQSYSWDSA
ncbi:uncharacterized protein PGRI_083010 [Penicillium griseofulvum]|uniref:Oxidoreductase acuF-like C2H2 type zinc-finger domain-containing protein n=1 Tax=Penicillium patulum TaxID=5078 RepID=A0A135LSR6_PENPA|nr:uncharacterized protein PGRI_083010 [Penicillium griseofulvum]KXG52017.1 hypothetical protein PGRI_083010 [Penicillium griseofulvum]